VAATSRAVTLLTSPPQERAWQQIAGASCATAYEAVCPSRVSPGQARGQEDFARTRHVSILAQVVQGRGASVNRQGAESSYRQRWRCAKWP